MSSEDFEEDQGLRDDHEVTSSLMGLFSPPLTQEDDSYHVETKATAMQKKVDDSGLRRTMVSSNRSNRDIATDAVSSSVSATSALGNPQQNQSFTTLFEPSPLHESSNTDEASPLLSSSSSMYSSSSFGNDTETPKVRQGSRKSSLQPQAVDSPRTSETLFQMYSKPLPPIEESERRSSSHMPSLRDVKDKFHKVLRIVMTEISKPSTWIGSFMCLLFHNVYCLTMGSAIAASHRSQSMLGLFTKMAALGVMTGAPVYWINLKGSSEIPALYPAVDLFTAPFLAAIAALVDQTVQNDSSLGSESDQVFLATFTFLACLAILLAGSLMALSGVFKLANLGSFLPFPVLAGFFAAVGVLTWTLAFKIDTQMGIGEVLFSGNSTVLMHALLHHSPSFIIGGMMKYLGPFSPFYVIGLVISSIGLFYIILFTFGISMEQATEEKWFWSQSDLVYKDMNAKIGFTEWAPSAPFGLFNSLLHGKIHWAAVANGLEPTLALAFLYLIRCSIHAAALKKNVPTLKRIETIDPAAELDGNMSPEGRRNSMVIGRPHSRKFSEVLDLEQILVDFNGNDAAPSLGDTKRVVSPRPTSLGLKDILQQYGTCQLLLGLVGAFAVVPSVAISPTMYLLRAENVAPQLGSCILLFCFYMTDFKLVGGIPKTAFSSLLVLAFLDMTDSWLIKSYFRIKEKIEWLVVPMIVISASFVGLLSSVFLGLALSTMIFVANFFRSGVVKFIANGRSVRSTIERPPNAGEWLDRNGELIQILVLQNYLFFGNASSILSYVSSMFEDANPNIDPVFVPPIPKVIVIDLTLVTGMDTSSVDVFKDVSVMCNNNECKLFLTGMSQGIIKTMSLSGLKADTSKNRSSRKTRFFSNLDKAVGKAEDMLLQQEGFENHLNQSSLTGKGGFEHALEQIDEQHSLNFAASLKDLGKYTRKIVLEPGKVLYEDVQCERGLFFIEHGIVKVERDADASLTRNTNGDTFSRTVTQQSWGSLNHLKCTDVARAIADMKKNGYWEQKSFRVARVGPGWIIGTLEAISNTVNPGVNVAVSRCELHFISFDKLKEVEETDPLLVLSLYKLLSTLMAKRQSLTINQLATLHSIMSSSAQMPPLGRHNLSTHLAASGH